MGNRKVTGADIIAMGEDMFGTDKLTEEQLAYILDMLQPSTYMLKNHTIKGKPMTFSIPNRNYELARNHRPWQSAIVNDENPNLVVMKSRQLGLIASSTN